MARALRQRGGVPASPSGSIDGSPTPVPGPTWTGLRRVDWVRLTMDERGTRAEAVGVGFRVPACRPIPLSLAARLVASGTPCVTWRPQDGV